MMEPNQDEAQYVLCFVLNYKKTGDEIRKKGNLKL